jgi:hypothetical protein
MSSFLTALTSIGSQYGEAKEEARQEKEVRAEKLRNFDIREAQLQLERQAGERAQRQLEQNLKAGKFLDFNLPTYTEGGVRYKTFYDTEAGKFAPVQIGRYTNSVDGLKHVMSLLPKEQQPLVQSAYESTLQSTGDEPKALEKATELVNKLAERKMIEDAAEERRQRTQEAVEKRAQKSRAAASQRQQASFAEREKLNSSVTKALGEQVDADNRVTRMVVDLMDANNAEQHPDDPRYKDGAGAFDMDMLSQHVALTFGAIKGGMRSKAMIDEHRDAVALLERVKRAYQSGVRGSQLSPQQRNNFLKLGRIAQQAAHDKYKALRAEVQSTGPVDRDEEAGDTFDLQPETEQP